MPKYFSKKDTTRATPAKKGDITLKHNLLDIVGETLFEGLQKGRLDPRRLKELQANVNLDLGKGYNANLGYNEYMGDLRKILKPILILK